MSKKNYFFGCLFAMASITAFSLGNALIATDVENSTSIPTSTATSLPYEKSFKTDMNGWYTIDANGDGATWSQDQFGAKAKTKDMASLSDDYLVSPEFEFVEGDSYKVTITMEIWGGTSDTDHFALYLGNGPEASAFTKIKDITLSTSTLKDEIIFTAGESATKCIAIYSDNSYFCNWYITGVKIESLGVIENPDAALIDADFTADTELRSGWTTIDGNEDGATWHIEEGLKGVSLTRSSKTTQNDWLVSPSVSLTAGESYLVSYAMSATGGFENEEVAVYAGNGANAQSLTTLLSSESIEDGKTATTALRFTPTVSSNFHFGIHATSPARNGSITVSYFKVEKSNGVCPTAPSAFEATPSIKEKTVTLNWVNPNIDTENVAIAGVVKTNIYMNDNLIATVPGAAGAAMSYIDTPAKYEGEAVYRLVSFCEDGLFSEPSEVKVSLDDYQGEIKSLKIWGGQGNEGFSDWTIHNIDGYQTFQPQSWDNSLTLNYKKNRDDWAVSPTIELQAKRRYVIRFTAQTSISWGCEFEITLGNGTTVESQTTVLMPSFNAIGNGPISYESAQFSVEEDGNYHIGVHCTNTETFSTFKSIEILYYENGNKAVALPYVESFDSASSIANWTLSSSSTFAVSNGALTSTASARDEYIFTPSFEMHSGFGYEVEVDYEGSEGFSMAVAKGQSGYEFEAAENIPLSGKGTERFTFTPESTATYSVGFKSKNSDGARNSINNISVGSRIYTTLPIEENFTEYPLNTAVYPWANSTAIAVDDCADMKAMKFNGTTTSPWVKHTKLIETLQTTFSIKNSNSPVVVKALYDNGTSAVLGTINNSSQWTSHQYTISNPGEGEFGVAIQFESESEVLIDNFNIGFTDRNVVASAPSNLQVAYSAYSNRTTIGWTYPTLETSGIELTRDVRVNIYRNNELIGYETGKPGTAGSISIDHVYNFKNGVMMFRAEAQVGDIKGEAITKAQYEDLSLFTAPFKTFSISDNSWSQNGSWTLNSDNALSTTAAGSLTSGDITITNSGMEYLVNFSMIGSANDPLSMKASLVNESGAAVAVAQFDNYYVGKEDTSYPTFSLRTPALNAGKYKIVFDVTSCKTVAIKDIEMLEVHTYNSTITPDYSNDFEDAAISDGRIAPNWTIQLTNSASRWGYYTINGAYSGSRALVAPKTAALREDLIFTPFINFEQGETYTLEFAYKIEGSNTQLHLVAAEYATSSDFEVYQSFESATNGWQKATLELKPESTFECLFGFLAMSTVANDGMVAIDDFKITKGSGAGINSINTNSSVSIENNVLVCESVMQNVTIFDVNGRSVIEASHCSSVNLSELAAGVYVARIIDANGNSNSVKFVR